MTSSDAWDAWDAGRRVPEQLLDSAADDVHSALVPPGALHQRVTAAQNRSEPFDRAAAEGIEALEGRRARPGHEDRNRAFALSEIGLLQGGCNRDRY